MKDSRHKPKTPRTKRTEQGVPDIYKTSAKEFQKLLKRACRTSLGIVGRLSVPFLGDGEAAEVGSSLIPYKNRGKGDTKINLKGFSYGC